MQVTTTSTRRRVVLVVVSIVILSVVLAAGFNRWIFGYWFVEPTVLRPSASQRVVAASTIYFVQGSPWIVAPVSAEDADEARHDMRSTGDPLPEQRHVAAIRGELPTPPLDLLQRAERLIAVSGAQAERLDPGYRLSSITWRGIALLIETADGPRLLIARRTGEVTNDEYFYTEALLRTNEQRELVIDREVTYHFQVAGIEGTTWRLLWPALLVAMLLATAVFKLISLGIRFVARVRASSART